MKAGLTLALMAAIDPSILSMFADRVPAPKPPTRRTEKDAAALAKAERKRQRKAAKRAVAT